MKSPSETEIAAAYQLLLGRQPESQKVVDHWKASGLDHSGFIRALLSSPECVAKHQLCSDSPYWHLRSTIDAEGTVNRFQATGLTPSQEHLTNFLGLRVRPTCCPSILAGKEGQIEPPPLPANWHADLAEWAACLHAVETAGDEFRMIELGCGWCCWMGNTGVAARSLGKRVRLVGVEGDSGIASLGRTTLVENGFTDSEFSIHHGVVGGRRGTAYFPRIVPGSNWGGEMLINPPADVVAQPTFNERYSRVPIVELADVIPAGKPLDLLHVDIQGAELDLLREVFSTLRERVRIVVIGTHSRTIEGGLFDLFSNASDWRLFIERPAIFRIETGQPQIAVDGVQAWMNTKVPAL